MYLILGYEYYASCATVVVCAAQSVAASDILCNFLQPLFQLVVGSAEPDDSDAQDDDHDDDSGERGNPGCCNSFLSVEATGIKTRHLCHQ